MSLRRAYVVEDFSSFGKRNARRASPGRRPADPLVVSGHPSFWRPSDFWEIALKFRSDAHAPLISIRILPTSGRSRSTTHSLAPTLAGNTSTNGAAADGAWSSTRSEAMTCLSRRV